MHIIFARHLCRRELIEDAKRHTAERDRQRSACVRRLRFDAADALDDAALCHGIARPRAALRLCFGTSQRAKCFQSSNLDGGHFGYVEQPHCLAHAQDL